MTTEIDGNIAITIKNFSKGICDENGVINVQQVIDVLNRKKPLKYNTTSTEEEKQQRWKEARKIYRESPQGKQKQKERYQNKKEILKQQYNIKRNAQLQLREESRFKPVMMIGE